MRAHPARLILTPLIAATLMVPLAACASDPAASTTEATATASSAPQIADAPAVVDAVAEGLETPWGVAFLPSGSALVTERDTGRILEVAADKPATENTVREVGRIDDTVAQGESG